MTNANPHPTSEILSLYHDGEGAREMLADVEAHLAQCGDCRAALGRLRALSAELRALPDESAPPELLASLAAGIRKHGPPAPARPPIKSLARARRIEFLRNLAALFLIAAVVAYFVIEDPLGAPPPQHFASAPAGDRAPAADSSTPAPPPAARSAPASAVGDRQKSARGAPGEEAEGKHAAEARARPIEFLGIEPVEPMNEERSRASLGGAEAPAPSTVRYVRVVADASRAASIALDEMSEHQSLLRLESRIRAWSESSSVVRETEPMDDTPVAKLDEDASAADSAAAGPLALRVRVKRDDLPALLALLGATDEVDAQAQSFGFVGDAGDDEEQEPPPEWIELRILLAPAPAAPSKTEEKR